MKPTQLDAIVAWALAALKGTAQRKTLRAKLDKAKAAAPLVPFALDALERRIVELAWAAERSSEVAAAARARGGLTVENVRAALDDAAVDAALSLKRALRRHALVSVGAGGAIAAGDGVRLAPGLAARLDGNAEPDALWPGMARLTPGARGDVPLRLNTVLEELDPRAATLLTLDGCARREAHELALGLSRRSGRSVLFVDGELLATAPSPWLLLACARREADLDGDALLVCQSAALGEQWRALLAPAPGETVPLVILADAVQTRDPLPAPWLVRRLSLHAPATVTATATASAAAEATGEPKPAPIDDGLDHVRQMAIRDAERALGIFRPPTVSRPTAATSPAPPKPAAAPPPPAATAPPPAPVAPPPLAPPSPRAFEEPLYGPLPDDPAAARAEMKRRRAAANAAKEARARAEAAKEKAAADLAATTGAATAATVNATAATANASAAAANATASGAQTPPPDGPPMSLPAEPALEDLVRACNLSPSSTQRIEIIGKLRGIKHQAVVAALRANATSAHPGVRAAAEHAMAALFGPNWNVSRPVPKPVQPPPSDDKDRGPPGGW